MVQNYLEVVKMISDLFNNFDFRQFKESVKNISINFLGITLEFDDLLIIAIILFLIYEGNEDYILYIILALLIFSD